MKIHFKYRGAGILFCAADADDWEVLLGRRKSGVWSIPGGGREEGDWDAWATARRETGEEFGGARGTYRSCSSHPIPWAGFITRILL